MRKRKERFQYIEEAKLHQGDGLSCIVKDEYELDLLGRLLG